MPSVLHGRIVHRFQLNFPEKYRREKRRSVATVPTAVTGNKNDTSSEIKQERRLVDNCITRHNNCGFIFIPDDELHPRKEHLLSLPKRLVKHACDAVRLERKVMIMRYTEIPFLEQLSTSNGGSRVSTLQSSPSTAHALIEIHELEICPAEFPDEAKKRRNSRTNDTSDRNADYKNNLWTLTQFWRKERLDYQKMKNSRPKFSLLATVNAISPIVALDLSNPFALIEVYDKDNTDVTCVVVLRGNLAMLNHAAIYPLDTLIFHDVVYTPWAAHKVLYDDENVNCSSSSKIDRQWIGRIPSHVFVATGADSVSWNHEKFNIFRQESSFTNSCLSSRHRSQSEQAQNRISPIITPIYLVTKILGKICNVETLPLYDGCRTAAVIHYLDIIIFNQSTSGLNDNNGDDDANRESSSDRPRCRLYLSYFPMSMALQCSLRREGIIQAHNVHLVCSHQNVCFDFDADKKIIASYGACLRSTLIILKHASDFTILPTEEENDLSKKAIRKTESCIKHDVISASTSLSTQSCEQFTLSMKAESAVLQKLQERRETGLDTCSKDRGCTKKECHSIVLPYEFINYRFRRINQTYLQEIYFEHVKDWELRSFQGSLRIRKDCPMAYVLRTWIVNVLLDSNRQNRQIKNKINSHSDSDDNPLRCIPLKANRRLSIRSPYAEFFDHPFSFRMNDDGTNMQNPSCSCHLSVEDRKKSSSRSSALLDLNYIRIASQRCFENHISSLFSSFLTSKNTEPLYKLRKGFHGSFRIPLGKLYAKPWKENFVRNEFKDNTENDDAKNCSYIVAGFVSEVHAPTSSVASIADGACQLPISFDKSTCHANINDFIMGRFDSVMISCLCLGNLATENVRDSKDIDTSKLSKSTSLPTLNSREKDLLGNCTLVTISGFLFVTAIQIHCCEYQLHKVTMPSSKEQEKTRLEDVTLTIDNCLEMKELPSKSFKSVTLMGMLTRCRFHSQTSIDSSSKCCRLTISSLKRDESDDLESDNSCLQAIELAVSVVQSTATMVKFNEMLDTLWPKVKLIGSQRALGSSFWVLGDCGRTCAMTFGGSEDIIPGSSCSKIIIKVAFPSSSLELNKLGYVRSLCTHDCLDVFFENFHPDEANQPSDTFAKNLCTRLFDFVGGFEVMAGMLHRRPYRRNIFKPDSHPLRSIGELSTQPSNAIPLNTLVDLFELVYQGLRAPNTSRRIMNPSLVRRISKCRFLNVSFCQVQCYCTRCFCSLINSSSNTKEEAARTRKRKREHSFHETSFWHLPLPEDPLLGIHCTSSVKCAIADSSTVEPPQDMRLSKLRCPKNNCPMHVFGVKWECSGVLDDGTGQATMYANGDAALTLLGMSVETIQIIEEGVRSMRNGSIQFMKSIPPPQDLRDKVIDILAGRRRHDLEESAVVDPIRLLSIQDRAIYLLERHCRSSSRPRRLLDYYVRCKPLSRKSNVIPHVHNTTIDCFLEDSENDNNGSSIICRGQVGSYTIPSLKLELVDCGVCSFESL